MTENDLREYIDITKFGRKPTAWEQKQLDNGISWEEIQAYKASPEYIANNARALEILKQDMEENGGAS